MLAITFDGLLQPLGYSQVARVVVGLARSGLDYTIVSLERESHVRDVAHVARVERALRDAGVRWLRVPYREGGGASAIAENLRRATLASHRISTSTRFDLVHARALHAGLVARSLGASRGIPYLFDARGYWVDEQVAEGRRFQGATAYRVAKSIERRIFADAAAVVTLTELHADDVRRGLLGPWGSRPVECIPTCADYVEFQPRREESARPRSLREVPLQRRTIGIVGSMNRSYYSEETLDLAGLVLERDPSFHLVILSDQRSEFERAVRARRLPTERVFIGSVRHDEMPAVLPHIDWALLLLRENPAKRASMPTKLAEFFASGVGVAQFGCNSEVSAWVDRSGNGFVLPSMTRAALEGAADRIVTSQPSGAAHLETRRQTEPHFSLRSGIQRYAERVIGRI